MIELLTRLWKRYHRLEHAVARHHTVVESVRQSSDQLNRTLATIGENLDAAGPDRRVTKLERRSRPIPVEQDRRSHVRRASDG